MINRETATPATNIPVATRPAGFEQLGAILSAMNEQLAALSEADFAAETDCAGWRVRDVVAHLAASAEEMKWPWGFPVRTARGRRRYPESAPPMPATRFRSTTWQRWTTRNYSPFIDSGNRSR